MHKHAFHLLIVVAISLPVSCRKNEESHSPSEDKNEPAPRSVDADDDNEGTGIGSMNADADIEDTDDGDDVMALLDRLDEKVDAFSDYKLNLTQARLDKNGKLSRSKRLALSNASIVNLIWPSREAIHLTKLPVDNVTLETIRDDDRAGQIGLRVEATGLEKVGISPDHIEWVYWLDEKRDYLPVEALETCYAPDDGVAAQWSTRFLGRERTQDGDWYPRHWQNKFVGYENGTPGPSRTIDYQLTARCLR